MLTDGAKELTLGKWGDVCKRHHIYMVTTEPYSPWQNPAELSGGIVKRKVSQLMKATNTPIRLWDYYWEYSSYIRSLTAARHINLDDVTPLEKIMGFTPNISEYLFHEWFDWVWFHNPMNPQVQKLGRWLGPAHNCGQGFAFYILSDTGKVFTRFTISKLSSADHNDANVLRRKEEFTTKMEAAIGNFSSSTNAHCEENLGSDPYVNLFDNDEIDDQHIEFQELDSNGEVVGVPEFEPKSPDDHVLAEASDEFVNSKVPLSFQGELKEGIIKRRKRTADGLLLGTKSDSPITDSRVYEVKFPDGTYQDYSANVIIESLYAHVDDNGLSHGLLTAITDHAQDAQAVPKSEGMYETPKALEG